MVLPYSDVFEDAVRSLREDGGYRTFIELERNVGAFPVAVWRCPDGSRRPVMVWCSNEDLGMGHSPLALGAMHDALDRYGAGAGGTRNISGTAHDHVLLKRWPTDAGPQAPLFRQLGPTRGIARRRHRIVGR